MSDRPPVRVDINTGCNCLNGGQTDEEEIDRDEWEALTPQGRIELLDGIADGYAENRFAWGWHVPDADDMRMTEEGT